MRVLITYILLSINLACVSQNKNTAKDFNEKAMKLYNTDDTSQLFLGLQYLDSSINIDANYITAYANKVNFLIKLKRRNEAIKVLESLIKKKHNVAESLMMEGFLYEKMEDSTEAQKRYKLAMETYKTRIQNDPNNISNQVNLIFSEFMITNDKQSAIKKINDLKNKFPQNELAKSMYETIEEFDRDNFMQQF